MAMQTGIGVSKILILAGAGYTGTILMKNGKLSDILGDLQELLKKGQDGDSDSSDALAQQIKRMSMELKHAVNGRQNIVINGSGQTSNLSGFIVPAATVGALGYGYMRWKGLKFSDLMYVTKRNMANAVSNLTKHLEQVSQALSAAKTHLTQRIQLLDDKMDTQKELSKAIQKDVNTANENLSQINSELYQLQNLVCGLDGRILSLEQKQDLANMGVWYLCNFVNGIDDKMPDALKEQLEFSVKNRSALPGVTDIEQGLKGIFDIPRTPSDSIIDSNRPDILDMDDPRCTQRNQPKPLLRLNSARC